MSNETLFLIITIFLVLFLVWALVAGRPLFRHSVAQDIRTTGHDMMN